MAVAPAGASGANFDAPILIEPTSDPNEDPTETLTDSELAEIEASEPTTLAGHPPAKSVSWAVIEASCQSYVVLTNGHHPNNCETAQFVRGPFVTAREAYAVLVEELLLRAGRMTADADAFARSHLHDSAEWRKREGGST